MHKKVLHNLLVFVRFSKIQSFASKSKTSISRQVEFYQKDFKCKSYVKKRVKHIYLTNFK
jgi:hypothetical protein